MENTIQKYYIDVFMRIVLWKPFLHDILTEMDLNVSDNSFENGVYVLCCSWVLSSLYKQLLSWKESVFHTLKQGYQLH